MPSHAEGQAMSLVPGDVVNLDLCRREALRALTSLAVAVLHGSSANCFPGQSPGSIPEPLARHSAW